MINRNTSAVVIVIPWCDKDGRDEKGRPWHTREPDLLVAYSNIQKNFQHFRNPHHTIFIVVTPKGLNLNGR